jgi:hypothetical protein
MPDHTNHTDERRPTSGPETRTDDRYESVETETGEVMVYDREIDQAWIQSTHAVTIDDWR